MEIYEVIYDNGCSYEDWEQFSEGLFTTKELAQEWIDNHPLNPSYEEEARRFIKIRTLNTGVAYWDDLEED